MHQKRAIRRLYVLTRKRAYRLVVRSAGLGAGSAPEFDAAEYLDSPEMIATYLKVAFEENDAALIRTALNDVARAKGMTAQF